MKYFLIIVLAFISILITALYGEEQLDSNNISYPFPLRIRAIYNIEKQKNKDGISRDDIAVLEENHKRILDKSFKEYLFQIKQAGKSYSVFKGEHCLFSGLYNLNSFMSNFEAACFLAARSNKITFGIHRVDHGALISDYEQLKLYVCQAENTQEISFPPNFYPSQLFLSSKNNNIFIQGTIIQTTKEGHFSRITADNAFLFYDMKLKRLYPVFIFSSVDSTVSAKVLDLSTDKTAFILLGSINGRGHTQTIFEIVIDKTNYIVPTVLIVPVKLNDKNTSLPHISRQNDFQEHDIFHFRDSLMHQKAAADGARYYSLDDKNHRKYNTFFVIRRDYPDKYSICSHLWFDAKYAVTSKNFHLFVKCFSPDKNRPECVRLYYGVSGCYSIVTLRQPFQGTALVNAADYRLPWGKFFCKTTTSPDGKIASSGNELAAGESGYFLFPLYSRKPVSAVDFGRIVDLIKKPVSHN